MKHQAYSTSDTNFNRIMTSGLERKFPEWDYLIRIISTGASVLKAFFALDHVWHLKDNLQFKLCS